MHKSTLNNTAVNSAIKPFEIPRNRARGPPFPRKVRIYRHLRADVIRGSGGVTQRRDATEKYCIVPSRPSARGKYLQGPARPDSSRSSFVSRESLARCEKCPALVNSTRARDTRDTFATFVAITACLGPRGTRRKAK